MVNFNLIVERWIPVLRSNGSFERVGIREALTEAGSIRQIAASNPMDNVALLRFLLAVLMWCMPGLDENNRERLDEAGGIPKDWLEKLGTTKQPNPVFDLLGIAPRFMQAPATAGNPRPVADLFHELPGATNVRHLRHITDYFWGACPACIAVGLVRLPVAMTGKGSGKRPGINGDPPLYFVPIGRVLLETLKHNLPFDTITGDTPCWVPGHGPIDERVGVMEGFTWISRQFRIADDGLQTGTCLLCGTVTQSLVTRLLELNKPNGRDGLSRADAERWHDPHLVYDDKGKAVHATDCERDLPCGSGQWRDWRRRLFEGEAYAIPPLFVASRPQHCEDFAGITGTAIATRQNDKSIESISLLIRTGNHPEMPARLTRLNDAVRRLLDPAVTRKGDGLYRFKAKHSLRFLRHRNPITDPPLPDSVRAAMAARLPDLEHAMQRALDTRSEIDSDVRDLANLTRWREITESIALSTTPGSPLRRREATMRACSALDRVLQDAASMPNEAAKQDGTRKAKRTRKKKGTVS